MSHEQVGQTIDTFTRFSEAFAAGSDMVASNVEAVISNLECPVWDGADGPGYSYLCMDCEGNELGGFSVVHEINAGGHFLSVLDWKA